MKKIAYWALPLLLIGVLTTPALAQAQQAQPKQPDPKWKDTKEYNDYIAVYEEKDQAKRAAGAEKFFVDHKDADPIALTEVYKYMLLGYVNSSNWTKVFETLDRTALAPKLTDADKKQNDLICMFAGAQSKNNPKTIECAEKVLKNDPRNFNALITLSGVLSTTLPPSNPAKDQQIVRALEITKQALDQPKPQGVPDAQWNPIQQQLRETTCLMLLNQKKYPESIAECQAALKINPKDAYAYYWIGLSHKAALIDLSKKYNEAVDNYNNNRTAGQLVVDEMRAAMQGAEKVASDKRDETVDAFAKAAAIGGDAGKLAMTELQAIFTGTPAELTQLIEEKKKQLGD